MTLKEIYQTAKREDKSDVRRFMRDMKRAGLRMRAYNGRWFWHGPAARVDHVSDALQATKVKCQWDNLGKGYIVYPRQSLGISV
jgi:hypothetical protein